MESRLRRNNTVQELVDAFLAARGELMRVATAREVQTVRSMGGSAGGRGGVMKNRKGRAAEAPSTTPTPTPEIILRTRRTRSNISYTEHLDIGEAAEEDGNTEEVDGGVTIRGGRLVEQVPEEQPTIGNNEFVQASPTQESMRGFWAKK